MRISLLTSSRADFGIQLPLVRALEAEPGMHLRTIAFGSHADPRYGHTVREVQEALKQAPMTLPPVLETDDPAGIARAMGATMQQFASVWAEGGTDLIIALGDRYEMFAAVAASLPFGIPVAHLHGGETTLGAIDNALRHAITHIAALHFTAAAPYRERVVRMLGHERGVHDTGALSCDNLRTMRIMDVDELRAAHGVDLGRPTVLVTLHPETVRPERADAHAEAFIEALRRVEQRYRVLITMPNADTHGTRLRKRLLHHLAGNPRAQGVESLGTAGYLACMAHCAFMLGNTSSGYIEAAWFPKPVIDVGERQTGRIVTPNIRRVPFDADRIMAAVDAIEGQGPIAPVRIYGDGHAAERMMAELRAFAVKRTDA
ncbi:MAG: UDP-N-acetylglucosamine 2-epimerase [Flavobacteriales bacterium]|jgi:GDP/UDP-N,N'-diacetylbacillosamine 2-epimerase (hydrolysing)|nr:UDP-N-acetylglucosamine 2-epimerase [Flavobacteriales bacterium]